MKEIGKNSVYVLLSQIPSNLFGILVGIIITRILGAEGRGVYYIFQANIQFLLLLLGFSLNVGITYFISSGAIELKKIFGIVSILLSFSVIGLIIVILVLNNNPVDTILPQGYDTIWFLAYMMAVFFLQLLANIFNGVLAGFKEFTTISKVTLYSSIINIGFFTILFMYHQSLQEAYIEEVFISTLLVQLSITFLWFWKTKKYFRVPILDVGNDLWIFLRYCIAGHLSIVINFFNYRFDLYVIAYFFTNTEVGYYSLSVSLAQFIWLVSNPLSFVLMPYISSSKTQEERDSIFSLYSKVNFSFALLGSAVLFLLSSLIPYIYGLEFVTSIFPFKILLIGTMISAIAKAFSTYLAARNLISINLQATIVGLIVTVVLDFLLIPKWGIVGASLASVATYVSIFIVVFTRGVFQQEFRLKNYYFITPGEFKTFYKKIIS